MPRQDCFQNISKHDYERLLKLKKQLIQTDPKNKLFYITGDLNHFQFHYKEKEKKFDKRLFKRQ